jgi:hypothetical protein
MIVGVAIQDDKQGPGQAHKDNKAVKSGSRIGGRTTSYEAVMQYLSAAAGRRLHSKTPFSAFCSSGRLGRRRTQQKQVRVQLGFE